MSFVMSLFLSFCVCVSAWNNSAPAGRIFVKFAVGVFFFFEYLSRRIQVSLIYDGALDENIFTFMICR